MCVCVCVVGERLGRVGMGLYHTRLASRSRVERSWIWIWAFAASGGLCSIGIADGKEWMHVKRGGGRWGNVCYCCGKRAESENLCGWMLVDFSTSSLFSCFIKRIYGYPRKDSSEPSLFFFSFFSFSRSFFPSFSSLFDITPPSCALFGNFPSSFVAR